MQIKSIHFLSMPVTSNFLFYINKKNQCHFDPVRLCGLFWGWGRVRKLFLNLDIQIENFLFLSIALSRFFTGNPIRVISGLLRLYFGYFGLGQVKKLFWGLLYFHFLQHFYDHFAVGVRSENCFEVSIFRLKSFIF